MSVLGFLDCAVVDFGLCDCHFLLAYQTRPSHVIRTQNFRLRFRSGIPYLGLTPLPPLRSSSIHEYMQ
jgi:hypothetical protein